MCMCVDRKERWIEGRALVRGEIILKYQSRSLKTGPIRRKHAHFGKLFHVFKSFN